MTHLPQEIPADIQAMSLTSWPRLGKRGELLKDYHRVSHQLSVEATPELMRRLDRLQAELDKTESWDISNQVDHVIFS